MSARIGARARESRRWLLAAGALVFAGLAGVSRLDWVSALAGFFGIGAAALLVPRGRRAFNRTAIEARRSGSPSRDLAWLSQFLEAVPDPAIVVSSSGAIVAFNGLARRQYRGLKSDGNISSVVRNPDFVEAIGDVLNAERAAPIKVSYLERVPIERRIDATLGALRLRGDDAQAEPLVMACLRDLSAQERTNRMRQDFIANASHELRTPLASLIGFIETLQGPARKDAKSQKRFLNIMAKQANRMTRLIDDLLSLSRVEMREHVVPDTVVDVSEAVRHVIDMLEPLACKVKVKIRLQGDAAPARVQGDRDELIQLFQNLVQNAVKYGADGEAVTVAIERQDDGEGEAIVAVSVSDRGAGIASEHLPRLTERFYRVDAASSRDKGGTGLGLAIVKHIVIRHGGELKISSEPGRGSTFRVNLPLVPAKAESSARGNASAEDASSAA